jgi:hypothetical protein
MSFKQATEFRIFYTHTHTHTHTDIYIYIYIYPTRGMDVWLLYVVRGLCDGLITRPEESCRLWRVIVCDQETSKTRRLKPATGLWKIQPLWVVTPGKQTNSIGSRCSIVYHCYVCAWQIHTWIILKHYALPFKNVKWWWILQEANLVEYIPLCFWMFCKQRH